MYETIDPTQEKKARAFHDRLNPSIWDETGSMLPEVRVRLLRAAIAFWRSLSAPDVKVIDIVLTGSNAAFNYTAGSDMDVHLVVDWSRSACPRWAESFFTAKKSLWNETHDVTIRGLSLEMYVEDAARPAQSNGRYSVLKGEWIDRPTATKPRWDDAAVLHKVEDLAAKIDSLLDGVADVDAIDALAERLHTMRQSGLADGGEFSTENLAYKSLRALGYLQRLYDARTEAEDRSLTLEMRDGDASRNP